MALIAIGVVIVLVAVSAASRVGAELPPFSPPAAARLRAGGVPERRSPSPAVLRTGASPRQRDSNRLRVRHGHPVASPTLSETSLASVLPSYITAALTTSANPRAVATSSPAARAPRSSAT